MDKSGGDAIRLGEKREINGRLYVHCYRYWIRAYHERPRRTRPRWSTCRSCAA
jgi:hypothetical protein